MALPKREFVQLAHTYKPAKHGIGGYYASEKLDGMRCYWDGGLSLNQHAINIPFANTAKDYRLKNADVMATGLWSRSGKVVRAPGWFLDKLPFGIPLDGELYLGPGRFQELVSIVKRHDADARWAMVKFKIFDVPSDTRMFQDGYIHTNIFKARYTNLYPDLRLTPRQRPRPFDQVVSFLDKVSKDWDTDLLSPVWQQRLPMQTEEAERVLQEMMYEIVEKGGEGAILRKPESIWEPKRSHNLLKVKPWADAEAKVLGYVWGKGKLEGLMGALIVEWAGKKFEISGFTNAERELNPDFNKLQVPNGSPGSVVADSRINLLFPRGSMVTFQWCGHLTDDGKPKEARYYRKPS